MTIQERLRRSNFIMLVVPVAIAGVLLVAGLGVLLVFFCAEKLEQRRSRALEK